ncbi:hypothetical protein J6590_087246 [Homalodisca vitripennis]|nr:hypothetical protein J6590_087246 [Homalodisca vitripennis]
MELAVGQFTRRGPIGALSQLCPIFKGAGLSSVMVSFFMATYYNVIIAYFLYYLFTSFRASAPWSDCSNKWNTPRCWQSSLNTSRPNFSVSPSEEFYDRKVLQLSAGIDKPGSVRWELAACLFLTWVIVYFALWKSVKSSGRVLYFNATLPFVLVLAFLGRSLTLEGADNGLQYFFKPQWVLLLDAKVWVNAVAQNFNSIGISFGSVISFASYNRYNNEILVDTVAVSVINAVTSLIVGIFAFATIGNIAREHSTNIENVINDGPGLVFILYPQAMAHMPFSNFWAVLFFFMLLCLGLNSQFAIVEVVVTSLQDGFPNWIKRNLVCHEILVLVICFISFIFGLPNIFQGGIYFFQLMDHYVVTTTIIYIALFERLILSGLSCITAKLTSQLWAVWSEMPAWITFVSSFSVSILEQIQSIENCVVGSSLKPNLSAELDNNKFFCMPHKVFVNIDSNPTFPMFCSTEVGLEIVSCDYGVFYLVSFKTMLCQNQYVWLNFLN